MIVVQLLLTPALTVDHTRLIMVVLVGGLAALVGRAILPEGGVAQSCMTEPAAETYTQ